MKTGNWLLPATALLFLAVLPLVSIVSGLAADLSRIHPLAGWAVWARTATAILILLFPIIRFLRLPSMTASGLWENPPKVEASREWRDVAQLLIQTSDEPSAVADLRRVAHDCPSDLPEFVRREVERRKASAREQRLSTVKQAAILALVSPNRPLDGLILLWVNLRQIYQLGRCYGFKPSPRGIFRLYTGVFGAAFFFEAIDEAGEQLVAEGSERLLKGIPFAGEAAAFGYGPIRAAAYVGLVGLLAEYLLCHDLRRPDSAARGQLRSNAWQNAVETAGSLMTPAGAQMPSAGQVTATSAQG